MSSSNRPTSSLVGEVIGQRFTVREHLDSTGQADVYRAEHVLTHKDVALKVSRAGLNTADEMVARFQRVARIATQLEHPNIIKINDFGLDDRGYVFLAMELGQGRDLRRILAEDGPLTAEEVVTVGLQILEGLGEAHRRGILHTELQPKYVMVDLSSGAAQVKLLGFGLGQLMHSIERGESTLGALQGDAAQYAAPELLRGGGAADHHADLFAVGAILFTALTGKVPWPAAASEPLQRADQGPPRASAVRTDGAVTMGLDRLLSQALDPDPTRRFSDATDMAAALRRAVQASPDEVSTVEAVHLHFGRYKLLRTIARGGMGELHLAVSETLPGIAKVCALKRLPPELAAEKSYVDRFLDEARLVSRLAHAGVATVYDVGKVEDSFYMAMEYVVGKDCRRIIDRAREDGITVPAVVALFVARELADALAYAHRARLGKDDTGLIHRDVSPTNVMVTYEGQVKLIDFGLAKHATRAGKTETGVVMGKVAYMAPEQCLGEPVDQRADIYAVGAVLFELLTGKRLREVEDFERLAEQVRKPVDVHIRRFRKDVPAELDLIFAKALAVDPAGRYPQAEGLRDDLSQVIQDIQPRMSRDVVAGFMRSLFAAEAGSEMDRAQVLRTEPAPARSESALPAGAGSGSDHGRTAVMATVDPVTMGMGAAATVVSLGDGPPLRPMSPPPIPGSAAAPSAAAASSSSSSSSAAVASSATAASSAAAASSAPASSSAPAASSASSASPASPASRRLLASTAITAPEAALSEEAYPLPRGSASAASQEPVEAPEPAARRGRGASITLAVLLLLLGLAGGFAVRDQLLPDFLRSARQGKRAPAAQGMAGQARPVAARPPEARPERPRPPEPRGPTLAELREEARAELAQRFAKLVAADLHALGVSAPELAALPELEEVHDAVTRSLSSKDLGKAVSGLGDFRTALSDRRFSCRRIRQAKYRWSQDRLRDLRRAAPRRRAERKAFYETHRLDALDQELEELRKRARDESLSCPEQSLAYAKLIPALVKTLREAGVPDEKWRPRRKGADAGDEASGKAGEKGDPGGKGGARDKGDAGGKGGQGGAGAKGSGATGGGADGPGGAKGGDPG